MNLRTSIGTGSTDNASGANGTGNTPITTETKPCSCGKNKGLKTAGLLLLFVALVIVGVLAAGYLKPVVSKLAA